MDKHGTCKSQQGIQDKTQEQMGQASKTYLPLPASLPSASACIPTTASTQLILLALTATRPLSFCPLSSTPLRLYEQLGLAPLLAALVWFPSSFNSLDLWKGQDRRRDFRPVASQACESTTTGTDGRVLTRERPPDTGRNTVKKKVQPIF